MIPHLIFNDVGQFPGVLYVQESVQSFGDLKLGEMIRSLCGHRLLPETPNRVTGHLARLKGDTAVLNPVNLPASVAQGKRFKTGILRSILNQSNPRLEIQGPAEVLRALLRKLNRLIRYPRRTVTGALRTFDRAMKTRRSMRDERAISERVLPAGKFVYFPLHFQPEASTSAKGRHFVDQREAVALVAESLPTNWMLVVKEHPHQWRRLYPRSRNYWKRIASIPKVRVIQAWANGKKVVFLGDSHLREAPGITCTSAVEDLKQLWERPVSNRLSETELLSYLQRVELATFEGALYGTPPRLSTSEAKSFNERTQHNITEVILCWLSIKGLTNYS
ncbi:MAG: hypothetical protein EBW15_07895 [Actinobacteria bacterium]|nr:hypothetical protein [Actinomycetota bacterium]